MYVSCHKLAFIFHKRTLQLKNEFATFFILEYEQLVLLAKITAHFMQKYFWVFFDILLNALKNLHDYFNLHVRLSFRRRRRRPHLEIF